MASKDCIEKPAVSTKRLDFSSSLRRAKSCNDPCILFNGVRSSWLMLAKKDDLAFVAFSALSFSANSLLFAAASSDVLSTTLSFKSVFNLLISSNISLKLFVSSFASRHVLYTSSFGSGCCLKFKVCFVNDSIGLAIKLDNTMPIINIITNTTSNTKMNRKIISFTCSNTSSEWIFATIPQLYSGIKRVEATTLFPA